MSNIVSLIRFGSSAIFFSFVIGAIYLGGDALNGKYEAGQYFLSWHGQFTEVSDRVFHYSYIHGVAMFVTIPTAIFLSFLSKPSPDEIKWLRLSSTLWFVLTIAYAFFQFGL